MSKKNASTTLLDLANELDAAEHPNYRAIIIRFRDEIAQVLAAGYKYRAAREALHKALAAEAKQEGRKPVIFTPETFRKWCLAEGLKIKAKSETVRGKKARTTPANAEPPEDESTAFKHSATPDTAEIYGSDE